MQQMIGITDQHSETSDVGTRPNVSVTTSEAITVTARLRHTNHGDCTYYGVFISLISPHLISTDLISCELRAP